MVPVGRVGERRVVSRHTQFFAIDPEWGLLKNPLTRSRKVPSFRGRDAEVRAFGLPL
jgi:hypothetical protein